LQRDIALLQEAYVPLSFEEVEGKRYYTLPQDVRRYPVQFSLADIIVVRPTLSCGGA
jgi:predicted DNA-binding transcriptional regulator YafY